MTAPTIAGGGPAALTPVQPKERIQTLDILRGFALFGILWMNVDVIWWDLSPLGHWIAQAGTFLADGKFRSLYSFLFGLGFSVQLLRAQERDVRIVPVYLRRLLVLLLIGLAHFVFLWSGDILRLYAAMGVLLLLLRRCPPRTLLVLAVASLGADIITSPTGGQFHLPQHGDAEAVRIHRLQSAEEGEVNGQTWAALRSEQLRGSYQGVVAARLRALRLQYSRSWAYFGGMEFCMFLLGLYAGRRGIFHNPAAHVGFVRRVMWWALGIGVTFNLADVVYEECARWFVLTWPDQVLVAIYNIGRPAMCLFYASAIFLLAQNERWRPRLAHISWMGRMGLTNYLFQSLAFTTILYAYGFGLRRYSSQAMGLGLTLVIYAVQIPLSKWWMKRCRFGPAEWVWRSLTYLKMQPMRQLP